MPNPADYQSDNDEQHLEKILVELDMITIKTHEYASKLDHTENEHIISALENIESLQESIDFSGPLNNESLAHNMKINTKLMTALDRLIIEFQTDISADFLENLKRQWNCYNDIDTALSEIYQKIQSEMQDQPEEEMNEPETLISEISSEELIQYFNKIKDGLTRIQKLAEQGILYEESFDDVINYYNNLLTLQNKYHNTVAFIENAQFYHDKIQLCQSIAKMVIDVEIKAYKVISENIQNSIQDNLILTDAKSPKIKDNLAMNKSRTLKSRLEAGYELISTHINLYEQLTQSKPGTKLENEILLRKLKSAMLNTISAALPEIISLITKKDDIKYSYLNHYIQLLCENSTQRDKEHLKEVLQSDLDKLRNSRDSDTKVWKAYAIVNGLNIINQSLGIENPTLGKNQTSASNLKRQTKSQ